MNRTRTQLCLAVVTFFLGSCESASGQIKGTYSIQTGERRVIGTPLAWDNQRLVILSGYGQYDEIKLGDVQDYQKKSARPLVYDRDSFSRSLQKEFGRKYQVSQTRDYLVVHPKGQTDYWPQKIQYMYDAFRNYFSSRRIPIRKKVYPLVAVVFSKRSEMMQYAKERGDKIPGSVVGYYSPHSNRVLIYDRSNNGRVTSENLETIVHEIAHQAAFNCGIHRRFSDAPGWVVEGLGMMFEAKGVHDSFRYTRRESRVHQNMLYHFRKTMSTRKWNGWVGPLITDNRSFAKDPERFYSCAWALSFFLMETQQHDYVNYLKKTERLPVFKGYSQKKRIQDFESAFGRIERLEGFVKNYYQQF